MDLFGIGGALLGGLLGGKDSQQQATTQNAPWAPAQPWIQANIGTGQQLQGQYAANPFSALQLDQFNRAYGLGKNFDDTRALLNKQLSQQRQFDRSAPLTRANQFNFDPSQTGTAASSSSGAAGGAPFGGVNWGFNNPFAFTQAKTGAQGSSAPAGTSESIGNDRGGYAPTGIAGAGVSTYSGGINGIMNGPIGITLGQIANAFGSQQAAAPVTDAVPVDAQAIRDAVLAAQISDMFGGGSPFGGDPGFGGPGGGYDGKDRGRDGGLGGGEW